MKLKITFKVNDGEKLVDSSKTFANIDENLTNEDLKAFVKAYVDLSDVESYQAQKITEERI